MYALENCVISCFLLVPCGMYYFQGLRNRKMWAGGDGLITSIPLWFWLKYLESLFHYALNVLLLLLASPPPSNFQTFLRPCMLPLARLKELLDHICILFRSRDHSLFGVIFGTLNHYKVPVAPAVTSLIENRFLVDFLNMNKIILHKSFELIVVWSASPTDFPCHHYFLNCVVFSIF